MSTQESSSPSKGRPTLTRIAAELGVSAKTVSNAYRHPDQLSADLRQRIFETADRLGFSGPDPLASSLRRGRAAAIGFIYDNPLSYAFNDEAAVAVLAGISEVAEAEGMSLMLVPGTAAGERDPAGIAGAAVDGVIAYSIASDDAVLTYTRRRGVPLVVIDQPSLPAVPRVGIDDEAAARAIATHLLDLGHRRLAILSFALARDREPWTGTLAASPHTPYDVTRRRLDGYAGALRPRVDLAAVPLLAWPGNTERTGRDAATRLLVDSPGPTALLCMSDTLALGALAAAQDLGLRVPEDVSIVGFDDVPRGSSAIPALTTISQPHDAKGRAAADLLFRLLRGEWSEPETTFPAQLRVRGSTAAPSESS